jgi:hypothetical protein
MARQQNQIETVIDLVNAIFNCDARHTAPLLKLDIHSGINRQLQNNGQIRKFHHRQARSPISGRSFSPRAKAANSTLFQRKLKESQA